MQTAQRDGRRGMTLVEVLIVVGAIAVLTAFSVPTILSLAGGTGGPEIAAATVRQALLSARSQTIMRPALSTVNYEGSGMLITPAGPLRRFMVRVLLFFTES